MKTQIELVLRLGIISSSQACHYSQVLMVPKEVEAYRSCIHFRRLNQSVEALGWRVPLVSDIFSRVGEKKSSIFGICDLTAGYH